MQLITSLSLLTEVEKGGGGSTVHTKLGCKYQYGSIDGHCGGCCNTNRPVLWIYYVMRWMIWTVDERVEGEKGK